MTRAVLWDADGVTIARRKGFFSDQLAARQGIDVAEILPFFKGEYGLCKTGKADLKEVLVKY